MRPPVRPAALRLLSLPHGVRTPARSSSSSSSSNSNTTTSNDTTSNTATTTTTATSAAPPVSCSGTGAKGLTGGGPALASTAPGAPGPPKVLNARVAGLDPARELSAEQRREVDDHNRAFAAGHDRGHRAPEFRVDARFWRAAAPPKQ